MAPRIYFFRDPAAVAAIAEAEKVAAEKRKPGPLLIALRTLGALWILAGIVSVFVAIVKAPKYVDPALIATGAGFVFVILMSDSGPPREVS